MNHIKVIVSVCLMLLFGATSATAQIGDIKKKPTIKQPTVKVPLKSAKRDADGDGRLSIAHGGDDCDDNDPARFPGNVEVADRSNHDEDCDPETFGFIDQDGDGFGADFACNIDDKGQKICGRDCDDTEGWIHPNQIDVFNGQDDNCNDQTDEHQSEDMIRKLLGSK